MDGHAAEMARSHFMKNGCDFFEINKHSFRGRFYPDPDPDPDRD